MTDNDWLQNLKVGDTVIVSGCHRDGLLDKVTRTTPTQILVGRRRFRKQDGRSVGTTTWHHSYLRFPHKEDIEEVERNELLARLSNNCRHDFDAIATDKLRQACALLFGE